MVRRFLDDAYSHGGGEEAKAFYDRWAESYDHELKEGGYVTPRRCAETLAALTDDRSRPVLDLGCGTGLSGAALSAAGFTAIDGWDPSAEMLRRAESLSVYRVLRQIEPDAPLFAPRGAYAAVIAAGVLSPGLAPPETIDQILAFLQTGGLLVFSLNDHALEHGAHEARVKQLAESGALAIVSRNYGPHIPAIELNAAIYALRKT